MKISFLGDSITEGYQASAVEKCYVSRVGDKLGCEVRNYGIGGTRIARQKALSHPHTFDMYFASRLDFIDADSDCLFVFGGVNDYIHGDAPLGDLRDTTVDTFSGALNTLIDRLIERFGKEKVFYIVPSRIYRDDVPKASGATLLTYVERIREVLGKKGIDYIDLYANGYPQPQVDDGDQYTKDGVHPNDFGYDYIADIVADFVRKKHLA